MPIPQRLNLCCTRLLSKNYKKQNRLIVFYVFIYCDHCFLLFEHLLEEQRPFEVCVRSHCLFSLIELISDSLRCKWRRLCEKKGAAKRKNEQSKIRHTKYSRKPEFNYFFSYRSIVSLVEPIDVERNNCENKDIGFGIRKRNFPKSSFFLGPVICVIISGFRIFVLCVFFVVVCNRFRQLTEHMHSNFSFSSWRNHLYYIISY